jgi:hypothetical protein
LSRRPYQPPEKVGKIQLALLALFLSLPYQPQRRENPTLPQ